MNKCNQTRVRNDFALIIDDSGHRKSGNFTEGVGRQYIGEIGKTDNGIVIVTTHLYDGVRSLPLDVESIPFPVADIMMGLMEFWQD